MGIGRDRFDRRFGTLLDSGTVDNSLALLVGDLYLNHRLGLAFRRPPGWVFEESSKIGEVAMGRQLDPGAGDLGHAVQLLTYEYLPLVTVAAPLRDDGADRAGRHEVRPVITLHIEGLVPERSAESGLPFDLLEYVSEDLDNFASVLQAYHLQWGPEPTRVSDCEAVEYRATYLYVHEEMPEPIPMRERCLYVAQNPRIYGIRMCDFPEHDVRLAFDFDEFVTTIAIS